MHDQVVLANLPAEDWKYHLWLAWVALNLAALAAALPNPHLSNITTGTEKRPGLARDFRLIKPQSTIQGDADLEFLFMSELAGPPVPADV